VLLENKCSGNSFFFYVNLIFVVPKRKDEIELAKSIFDEIVEETKSEDFGKPKKRQNKSVNPKTKRRQIAMVQV
jgi:hypothetical protein